jgi:hypothetical protein
MQLLQLVLILLCLDILDTMTLFSLHDTPLSSFSSNLTLNLHPSSQFALASEVFEHSIHLLKTATCCFGDEKIRPSEGKAAKDGEEHIPAKTSVLY